MLNEWTHSQIYSMVTNKYTKLQDDIIMKTLQNRGDNTIHAAAGKARKELFKQTNKKFSLPAIKGRYYKIRKDRARAAITAPGPVGNAMRAAARAKAKKTEIVRSSTVRETFTMTVRDVEITLVFK